MTDFNTLRQLALTLTDTTEQPHFEKTSFRVGKKIFATYDYKTQNACLKLSEVDQSVFSNFNPTAVYPVPNKWGKQGWTIFNLNNVEVDLLTDALTIAHQSLAGNKDEKKGSAKQG